MRGVLRSDLIGDTSAHEVRPATQLTRALFGSLRSRLNWGVALLAVVMAVSWSQLFLLAAIPTTFVLSFVVDLVSNARALARRPPAAAYVVQLPDEVLFRDGTAQAAVRRLAHTREERERTEREGPRGPAFDVAPLLAKVPTVESRVLVLAARLEYIGRFLAGQSPAGGSGDEMREAAAASRRPASPSESYLRSIRALGAERRRLETTMERMLGALEALPAAMVRLQCLRLRATDGEEEARALTASRELAEAYVGFEEAMTPDRPATSGACS
jgi:hypothetical protein